MDNETQHKLLQAAYEHLEIVLKTLGRVDMVDFPEAGELVHELGKSRPKFRAAVDRSSRWPSG